ncbi:ABC transporter ATP-binding protein [Candidatus Woesearchaeota archaeon]|nr:ABC transporter ATP-binding protein [Candidatus Woesearchaeota archaeon]
MATKNNTVKTLFLLLVILLVSSVVYANDPISARESHEAAGVRIEELQQEGYPTLPLININEDARVYFNARNYNASLEKSNEVFREAERIVELQKELIELTELLGLIGDFGVDVISLNLNLLYAKSDFEAANIDLARDEADKVKEDSYILLKNVSEDKIKTLESYNNNFSVKNDNNSLFFSYYNDQKSFFDNQDYASFLLGYDDFGFVKNILEENNTYQKNQEELVNQNISYQRITLLLIEFEEAASKKEYEEAVNIISDANKLAASAIDIRKDILVLEDRISDFESLGILDNLSVNLYESLLKEYSLESFEAAANISVSLENNLIKVESDNIIFGGINKASFKRDVADFFLNNWLTIIIFVIIGVLVYKPILYYFLIYYNNRLMKTYLEEKKVIEQLQRELQRNYYVDKFLDKNTYESDKNNNEDRIVEVSNNINLITPRLFMYTDYLENIHNKIKVLFKKRKKEKEQKSDPKEKEWVSAQKEDSKVSEENKDEELKK